MKVLVQRVLEGSVVVNNETVGQIGRGMLCLVGFGAEDTEAKLVPLAQKLVNMRLFPGDGRSHFDRSVVEIQGEVLLVPQFTLYADTNRGRRPDFSQALKPELARELFEKFIVVVKRESGLKVESGVFGADMKVALVNDGPVTVEIVN